MVGVWADPVTAHVMMTLRAGMSVSWFGVGKRCTMRTCVRIM